ncbi:MAG: tRNA 2-thiouridine(34) synthase MnmA [Pseudothermotoga sp.]
MKVGVLLSGGVDSAVALYTLKEEGHDVIAYHMKTMYDQFYIEKQIKHKVCCSPSDTYDAQLIARQMGVQLRVVYLQELFKDSVIKYFLQEYRSGKTPNPCYRCNRLIKFGYVMDLMTKEGVDLVASGHYARVVNGKLYKAVSKEKDQSYFLASIEKERLKNIVFPNGDKTKEQIREIARKAGIHVHNKDESQDLCFIPDGDQRSFFQEHGLVVEEGPIFDLQGNQIGKHNGLTNYTIGQRKIGISTGERSYVVKIDPERNAIVVGTQKDVYASTFLVKELNWLTDVDEVFEATVKVRKNSQEVKCQVLIENNNARVTSVEPIFAVTPGQIAVFYNGEMVVGSGKIDEVL